MPKFSIGEQEWEEANFTVTNYPRVPALFKLPRSNKQKNHNDMFAKALYYRTEHSFFKFAPNYPLLATNPKTVNPYYNLNHVTIGHGNYGKVKVAQNQAGELFALKIQGEDFTERNNAIASFPLNYDLWLALKLRYRMQYSSDSKAYTLMRYLGKSLSQALFEHEKNKKLNSTTCLRWSAKICFQVYKLHSGLQSSRGKPYVHGDIKRHNIVIDSHERIRLVDFDFASTNIHERPHKLRGTLNYVPLNWQEFSLLQRDIFALHRTLYFPENLKGAPKIKLLDDTIVNRYKLKPALNASMSGVNPDSLEPPLVTACRLALSICDIAYDETVFNSDNKRLALMVLLHANHLTKAYVLRLLEDDDFTLALASIASIADWLPADRLKQALTDKRIRQNLQALAKAPRAKRYLLIERLNKDASLLAKSSIDALHYPTMEALERFIALINRTTLSACTDASSHLNSIDAKIYEAYMEAGQNTVHYIDKHQLINAAVNHNCPELVATLLQLGGNPNIMDPFGRTPLMDAIWQGYQACYLILLRHPHIKLNIKNNLDEDAYHLAELAANDDNTALLYITKFSALENIMENSRHCYPSTIYLDESNALHLACLLNKPSAVSELLHQDIDINKQDSDGCTPLMIALTTCEEDIISDLLCAKPAPRLDIENNNHETIVDIFYQQLEEKPWLARLEGYLLELMSAQQSYFCCF